LEDGGSEKERERERERERGKHETGDCFHSFTMNDVIFIKHVPSSPPVELLNGKNENRAPNVRAAIFFFLCPLCNPAVKTSQN
jgi:hypothetical protein